MTKFVITIAAWNANIKASTIQIGHLDPEHVLPVSYIERALLSTRQDYPHYRIVVRDDASTDGTWEKIKEMSGQLGVRTDVAHNDIRRGALANHYAMSKEVYDDEVIVNLDGDDQLAGPDVLTKLAEVYEDPDVWMTYGSFAYDEESRSKEPGVDPRGFAAPMNQHDRRAPFSCTHLRTYKRWLFDRIRVEDLKYQMEFYQWIPDLVLMYPMIEMAGPEHSRYIHDILYLYNMINPYNEFKGPGAWPTDTEEQRQVVEEGEKRFGHTNVLDYDIGKHLENDLRHRPIYPRLRRAKDFPYGG